MAVSTVMEGTIGSTSKTGYPQGPWSCPALHLGVSWRLKSWTLSAYGADCHGRLCLRAAHHILTLTRPQLLVSLFCFPLLSVTLYLTFSASCLCDTLRATAPSAVASSFYFFSFRASSPLRLYITMAHCIWSPNRIFSPVVMQRKAESLPTRACPPLSQYIPGGTLLYS